MLVLNKISVGILQLEIKNYLTDWLLNNINITRVSILLQEKTPAKTYSQKI